MPRVTYKGRNAHREVRTDIRYLFFFPNIPMTIDASEVPIIEELIKAGEPYVVEYSPSERPPKEPSITYDPVVDDEDDDPLGIGNVEDDGIDIEDDLEELM